MLFECVQDDTFFALVEYKYKSKVTGDKRTTYVKETTACFVVQHSSGLNVSGIVQGYRHSTRVAPS
jgi:hypothetical protein